MTVAGALAALAPPGVRAGARLIDDADLTTLGTGERAAVARAVRKRQREFATGRALLRELMGRPGEILVEANRAPGWPAGWRGSLAHDDRWAVAVVTDDPAVAALGVDIEPTTTLSAEVAALILRPDEPGIDAHLAFSLKEAVYKAWSALGGELLDHHDVRLSVSPGRFDGLVVRAGRRFRGSYAVAEDRTLALVVVEA